jgi:hypothetical protein
LHVYGAGSVVTVVNVSKSVISNNQHNGVYVAPLGYVRLSGNQLTGNYEAGAFAAASGVIASMQDNLESGNGVVSALPTTIFPY